MSDFATCPTPDRECTYTCPCWIEWNNSAHSPDLCELHGHKHPYLRPDIDPEKLYSFTCALCQRTFDIPLPADAEDIKGVIYKYARRSIRVLAGRNRRYEPYEYICRACR